VLGAGGVIVPHETFMPLVRKICDKYDILLIADEVVTGFGRAGAWSGSRLWSVQPDMVCIAKAITSGYFPLGATLIGKKVAEAFEADKTTFGNIGTGYTYSGHPVGCAAGVAALAETQRLNLAENARVRGEELLAGLNRLKDKHQIIGDARGKGLMVAVELVSDRATKKPADKKTMAQVADTAFDQGVMIRISGPNIILSPPLILKAEEVDTIIGALDVALGSV